MRVRENKEYTYNERIIISMLEKVPYISYSNLFYICPIEKSEFGETIKKLIDSNIINIKNIEGKLFLLLKENEHKTRTNI